jgi:hypothetical protein
MSGFGSELGSRKYSYRTDIELIPPDYPPDITIVNAFFHSFHRTVLPFNAVVGQKKHTILDFSFLCLTCNSLMQSCVENQYSIPIVKTVV